MYKSKTVIGAIGAILAAAGGVMSGELEMGAAINVNLQKKENLSEISETT